MIKFNKKYFIFCVILFLIEVFIALFARDKFVRPYVGDFLVVILLYCFLKSFIKEHVLQIAFSVLVFSYVVEILQYFNLVNRLGLHDSHVANVIIGNHFEWIDMLSYTMGIMLVIVIESFQKKRNKISTDS